MSRVLPLLLAGLLLAVAAPVASAAATRSAKPHVTLARFGSSGFGYRSRGFGFGRSRYGYRPRRSHGFLKGLFAGWLFSHFFRGGFPLFIPLLLLVLFALSVRRRRRRFEYRY